MLRDLRIRRRDLRDAGDMGDVGYDSKWEIFAKFQKRLLTE